MSRYLPTSEKALLRQSCLGLREYCVSPPSTFASELIRITVVEKSNLSDGTSISDVDVVAACWDFKSTILVGEQYWGGGYTIGGHHPRGQKHACLITTTYQCQVKRLCFLWWTPPRVKCACLLTNGIPVPDPIDIREVK